jgi:membrane associated rhomboid family serine protease
MPADRQVRFVDAVVRSGVFVGILFLVKAAELLFRLPLPSYGILPRTTNGLVGIAVSPLLHASWAHLLANALPLFVLLILLLGNREYRPYRTLASIWVASGLGTWLIGRGPAVHLGASSLIFGLAAFLIVAGLHVRSWRSVVIAVFVFLFFGGIFLGVLPNAGPVSWEGHLCGALAGVWVAWKSGK